jgi:hypothetical protein
MTYRVCMASKEKKPDFEFDFMKTVVARDINTAIMYAHTDWKQEQGELVPPLGNCRILVKEYRADGNYYEVYKNY